MNVSSVVSLILALLISCVAVAQEPFSVMTWNLEWFYDDYPGDTFSKLAKEKATPSRSQWDWRRDAIAESIAEVSPTVVALQEVENRRVLWYLTRAIERNHRQKYSELGIQSSDHFTEQDVGFLFRSPVDVLSISQYFQTREMRASENYLNLSKHLVGVFRVPFDGGTEQVTVLNVHLRARAEAEPLRKRQARLIHRWVSKSIEAGENVIVLGDFNTEEMGDDIRTGSDLGIVSGAETKSANDDLVDLTLRVPSGSRATHLLGRQFDRIFASRSMVDDAPGTKDLVFESIRVRQDLAIREDQDDQQSHWERYWEIDQDERDLSDHYPVVARFEIR